MKRLLRVLILGPIFLVAMTAVTLVAPLCSLVMWLVDVHESMTLRETIREMWAESFDTVWNGV